MGIEKYSRIAISVLTFALFVCVLYAAYTYIEQSKHFEKNRSTPLHSLAVHIRV